MKKSIMMLFLLLAAAMACRAWPLISTGEIIFTVDGAAFSDAKGATWQQLYWSLPASSFAPVETLGQRLSRFRTVIQLKDSVGNLVLNEDWSSMAPLPSPSEMKRKNLVRLDQIDARSLRPGAYHLSFSITDLSSAKSGALQADLSVPAIRTDRPSLSQIQICTDIRADSTEKRFSKGGLKAVPNPGRIFTETAAAAYYYVEIYGLGDSPGTQLRISYNSANDSITGTIIAETLSTAGPQAVRAGGVKLDSLADGQYQLWVQLLDPRGRPLAATSAGFTVKRNPLALTPGSEDLLAQQAAMEEEGGRYYDQIQYIASGRQLDIYNKLDSLGRREFLRQFWKKHDTNPKTPANETLIEHARRYAYADDRFSEHIDKGLSGSQTDRGRIYIKYGEPTEIDGTPMDTNFKPSLIWRYPGSKIVVFVDINGAGRYEMVYTNMTSVGNMPGEHSNPRYYKLLSRDLMDAESIPY